MHMMFIVMNRIYSSFLGGHITLLIHTEFAASWNPLFFLNTGCYLNLYSYHELANIFGYKSHILHLSLLGFIFQIQLIHSSFLNNLLDYNSMKQLSFQTFCYKCVSF